MSKLIHVTSKEHHDKYATVTGGAGRAKLRAIVMEMIGNDIEALKEAYLVDNNLNNIDKVLTKAGTLLRLSGFGKGYVQQQKAMEKDFKHRCFELGVTSGATRLIENSSSGASWFLTFDMKAPEFIAYTKEGRKAWKEINNGVHDMGVSNSCICSGLKHIMIYDILGCEFVEEKR